MRGKFHLAEEPYSKSDADLEIVPLTVKRGTCVYVHMKAYVLVPDITLTVALYPQPSPQGAAGDVVSSHEQLRQREHEVGAGQAWYYPADRLIVLWECGPHRHLEDQPIHTDPNLRGLWTGFETFLTHHFAHATQIVTTYAVPEYNTREYQQFLTSLGYRQHPAARAAWSKAPLHEVGLEP